MTFRARGAALATALAVASAHNTPSCTELVTEAYRNILKREPDAGGLKDKVESCSEKKVWGKGSGLLEGQHWSVAGVVYEMRNSDEYQSEKLTPLLEKGGCRFCTARPSPYCNVGGLSANTDVVANCVISSKAMECCLDPPSTWGIIVITFVLVGCVGYVGGGIAYNVYANKMSPGITALPHREHWLTFAGLVADGVNFTHDRVRRSRLAHIIRKVRRAVDTKLGRQVDGQYVPIRSVPADSIARANARPPTLTTKPGEGADMSDGEGSSMFGGSSSSDSDSDNIIE